MFAYRLQNDSLQAIKPLNVARSAHSTIMLDTKLYVFCGSDANGRLRSVECLELSNENARWCLLEAKALYSCIYPLLTSIEDKKIIVVGGK